MTGPDLWSLPAARQFLAEVEPMVWRGGAVIATDASTPPGLSGRLRQHLRDDLVLDCVVAPIGTLPLAVLDQACGGCGSSMADVVASGHSLVIDASGLPPPDLSRWAHALGEFARMRAARDEGGALLFLGDVVVPEFGKIDWTGRLRRVDAMIWAEYAVPVGRSDLMQRLAVDLAVELCGWRLDLVADLVSQREEDIVAPMGWLERHIEAAAATAASFGTTSFDCPLRLLARNEGDELRRRIWSAQLAVLFPWIELHRQRLIERYRRHLYIDEHLKSLRVYSVEDIELGALRRQLQGVLARSDYDQVTALANLRNDLAHRKPVSAADFNQALGVRAG